MLDVSPVAAEVPLACRTAVAGDGIGPPHDRDDEVSRFEARARRGGRDRAERLVTEHEPLVTRRRPAVLAREDFQVRPADADRDRLDEHRTLILGRLGSSSSAADPPLPGITVTAFKLVLLRSLVSPPGPAPVRPADMASWRLVPADRSQACISRGLRRRLGCRPRPRRFSAGSTPASRCSWVKPWAAPRSPTVVFTSEMCEKAWGKLPTRRLATGSYSSESRPRSLRSDEQSLEQLDRVVGAPDQVRGRRPARTSRPRTPPRVRESPSTWLRLLRVVPASRSRRR